MAVGSVRPLSPVLVTGWGRRMLYSNVVDGAKMQCFVCVIKAYVCGAARVNGKILSSVFSFGKAGRKPGLVVFGAFILNLPKQPGPGVSPVTLHRWLGNTQYFGGLFNR